MQVCAYHSFFEFCEIDDSDILPAIAQSASTRTRSNQPKNCLLEQKLPVSTTWLPLTGPLIPHDGELCFQPGDGRVRLRMV